MALVQITEAAAAAPTRLRRGDTVRLRLPEALDGGYHWRWRLPEALVLVTDEPETGGPGGVRLLAFEVKRTGSHELRAELARPWEGAATRALTFVFEAE